MAVDSAGKRFSMLAFGRGPRAHPLPIPDGSFDAGDRSHLLGLYSGIAAATVLAGPWNFTELVVWSPGMQTGKVTQHGAVTGFVADHGFSTGLTVGTLKD